MTLAEGADLALAHAGAADENLQRGTLLARVGRAQEADEFLLLALDSLRQARGALREAGATPPVGARPPQPLPLHQLDTADTRALLAGVEALLPIAERIDAARGRAMEKPIAGRRGLDLAATVGELAARLRLEIHGPGERVTGGRE